MTIDIEDFRRYLAGLDKEVRQRLLRILPTKLGNIAVRMFKQNFQDEGFFGKRWQEVKRRGTKGAAGRRKILTGPNGDLGRSIQMKTGEGEVTIHSDLPYSEAHNEGTANAGRSHNVRIPQRQFMGKHPDLTKALEKKIKEELGRTK